MKMYTGVTFSRTLCSYRTIAVNCQSHILGEIQYSLLDLGIAKSLILNPRIGKASPGLQSLVVIRKSHLSMREVVSSAECKIFSETNESKNFFSSSELSGRKHYHSLVML